MIVNYFALFGSALIPLIVGAIWYSPKLFGNTWMRVAGKTQEELEGGNMVLIFVLTYILGLFIAVALSQMTNHQTGILQLFATHPDFAVNGSEIKSTFDSLMEQFGERHRSFGHGAIHGAIASIMMALPIVAIAALFERRGGKYIGIHFGYWLVTFILMGGVLCHFM